MQEIIDNSRKRGYDIARHNPTRPVM